MAKDFFKKSKSLQKYIGFRIGSVLFFHPVCHGNLLVLDFIRYTSLGKEKHYVKDGSLNVLSHNPKGRFDSDLKAK